MLFKQLKELIIQGFADADWASDPDDRKSTSERYAYILVEIYFNGLLRNKQLFQDQAQKQSAVSMFTYGSLQLYGVTTRVLFIEVVIKSFTPSPNMLRLTSIL